MNQLQRVNNPQWLPMIVLRALGYSTFVTSILSILIYVYNKKQVPINSLMKILSLNKKIVTISLKRTMLWNPSNDLNEPNHAFKEKSIMFLNKLLDSYDVYILIQFNNENERHQIQQLLKNNTIVFDKCKIFYCHNELQKAQFVKNIHPYLHIEGGSERNNGQQIVKHLSTIDHVIWITNEQNTTYNNIELSNHILNTSIAKQCGF